MMFDHLEIFALAGNRWTVPILAKLKSGMLRFGNLKRALGGISAKQLTSTLRLLERDGFVSRTVYLGIPPRVEYELTDMGADLVDRLATIGIFAIERRDQINAARERFDTAAHDVLPTWDIQLQASAP